MARIELSERVQREIAALDPVTASLLKGWMLKHLLPLENPRSIGRTLGGTKRWQYRIGDYRLIARITEKKTVLLALTHGHTLPYIS